VKKEVDTIMDGIFGNHAPEKPKPTEPEPEPPKDQVGTKRNKIVCNKVQCKNCNDIIESTHHYDFVTCSCKNVSVDGGHDYLRRLWKEDNSYIELSEYEDK